MAESNSSKFLDWRWLAGILLVALLAIATAWVGDVSTANAQTWVNRTNIEHIQAQLTRIELALDRMEIKIDILNAQRVTGRK